MRATRPGGALAHCEYDAPVAIFPVQVLNQPTPVNVVRKTEDEEFQFVARILIVEDEERIASFVSKGLAADGHHTTAVADGRVGLDHALSGEFDLMVLDIGLPGMNGFEVLAQLRSQGSKLPVIVLTSRDSVLDTVSALEGGADDYMPKPFRFAELLARIRLRLRTAPTAAPPETTCWRPAAYASTYAPAAPPSASASSSSPPASSPSPRP